MILSFVLVFLAVVARALFTLQWLLSQHNRIEDDEDVS
jgi:hypothetical protein